MQEEVALVFCLTALVDCIQLARQPLEDLFPIYPIKLRLFGIISDDIALFGGSFTDVKQIIQIRVPR